MVGLEFPHKHSPERNNGSQGYAFYKNFQKPVTNHDKIRVVI